MYSLDFRAAIKLHFKVVFWFTSLCHRSWCISVNCFQVFSGVHLWKVNNRTPHRNGDSLLVITVFLELLLIEVLRLEHHFGVFGSIFYLFWWPGQSATSPRNHPTIFATTGPYTYTLTLTNDNKKKCKYLQTINSILELRSWKKTK